MKLNISLISRKLIRNNLCTSYSVTRFLSSKESIERRNHLFTLEKKRQHEKVGRIEKIEVQYKGIPKDCTLIMNKDISTPYDCARHLSEWHAETSALALIDGQIHWDMHKPLTDGCTLELQNFNAPEPQQVNKAFWRTCSLVLGACASKAFKDNILIQLHSFPGPDIRSGSFTYDVSIPSLQNWQPTDLELRSLSAEYVKFIRNNYPIERLDVTKDLALEMFNDNEHKHGQIPIIAQVNGRITLYRVGDHVDISKGPMIANTSQIGRVTVASVHKITGTTDISDVQQQLYRFQGVALPTGVILNHFAYGILEKRAKKLNPVKSPFNPLAELEEVMSKASQSVRA